VALGMDVSVHYKSANFHFLILLLYMYILILIHELEHAGQAAGGTKVIKANGVTAQNQV
jgi:hypothetical protein